MMASDLSSGCTETIDILDDEKEEGEISLEDVSSSEEGGMGHLTSSYVISRTRRCPDCKSWGECATWCNAMYHSKSQSRRDPVKGKENRHHVRETGCTAIKHTASTLQEKNDDLVPISSDSDMEIVGLMDTSNRSKAKVKKKKRKKKTYEPLTIDDLISPSTVDLSILDVGTVKMYREASSVHRSSGRSKIISRPIRRYRSPVVASRSSFRSSRSPQNHSKSPIQKRSLRKVRSPKRSPRRHSPVRPAKRTKPNSPPPVRSHVDKYGDVTRLLKKVKHLDSIGTHASEPSVNRSKESSSLKEKLSNMMKRAGSDDHAMHLKGKSKGQSEIIIDVNEEEDLAFLRQKALETKQKKSNWSSDHLANVELEKQSAVNDDDDQDEEALQLRMIALRSAVMKKHQNRVQRGIKTKKSTRSESPFNSCFLEDIPVPGDELLKYASPPYTPSSPSSPSYDSNHIEDMDLDTDVEREKEKLPYSPTDKITENIPIDTALLGIEPSDVSFINVNETIGSPAFDDVQVEFATNNPTSYYDKTYLPHQMSSATQYYSFSSSQYGSETYHSGFNDTAGKGPENSHSDGVVCNLIDGICCLESTYPSTGVVPDTTHALSVSKNLVMPPVLPHGAFTPLPQIQQIAELPINNAAVSVNVDSTFMNDKTQAFEYPVIDVPTATACTTGYPESISHNELTITNNDLPENNADPLNSSNIVVADVRTLPATEHIPKEAAPCRADVEEPLYMQGVPDITKDTNKIPTLINRTLVPAPILKSNKLLRQQPLRKRETPHPEPAFKNAEMQPVTVTATDTSSSVFKPIKLQVPKKSAPVLSAPATFDNSTNESLDMSEPQGDSPEKDHEAAEPRQPDGTDISSETSEAVPTREKKRKRVRKNRKSFDRIPLLKNEKNACLYADVNKDKNIKDAIDRQTASELNQNKSNDNAVAQESSIENGELLRPQSVTDTQELVNFDNIMIEKNMEKNNHTALSMSAKFSQEEHVESRLSTNSVPVNSDLGVSNKVVSTTETSNDRRQSVDEDEDELRAILLASLKRTKITDTSPSMAPVISAANTAATNVQTPAVKTLASTMPSAINASTANNNSPSRSLTSETAKKKINDVSISVQNGSRERSSSADTAKNLPKKVTRKTLTSTKVVNNAKKYQNMIVQRRLNLRKLDNNTKPNENVWPNAGASKISLHSSDTQRFVISLGSDTDSESEGERNKPISNPITEKHQVHQEIVDFEKNLSKFLRDVRTEQEQSAAAAKSFSSPAIKQDVPQTDKGSSNMHTPLAVRHLPASQQEEYRRLKQEILEREKLQLQRKVASNNRNNSNNNNKLSNANVASLPVKSLPLYEKKTYNKQNQEKLKTPEKNTQELSTEIKRKSDDLTEDTSESNVCRISANKKLSANVTNAAQVKSNKKVIPNNLSIRISNVPSFTGSMKTENSRERQSAKDKQQSRPVLKALSTEEINRKYMQVMLKQDTIERVVIINDKSVLQHDTIANTGQNESPTEPDVSIEIINEKNLNNVNNVNDNNVIDNVNDNDNNTSSFFNASTVKLSNSSANSLINSRNENTMETTITLSQYEAERQREINRDTPTSVLVENNDNNNAIDNNNASRKSDTITNDNDNANDIWDTVKKNAKAELDSLTSLSKAEQERYLRETEYKLVAKRYMVLDHLAEMSGNLRQWDMEKDVQMTLAIEVRKLKEQLKIAEEKLQQQHDRVNSMGPKVSTARQKINAGRCECFKLTRICSTLGNRLMGKDYKLPEAVAQLLSDKLKEVANHTRQFTKKKRYQSNDISENSYSSLLRETSELFKNTCIEENLSLEEQPTNNRVVIDKAELKSDISRSTQSNEDKSLSIETSLDFSQIVPCQSTPEKREETSVNASEHCNKRQIASLNQDSVKSSSEPNLYQSNSTEQNNKQMERNRTNESDSDASSELKSSTTDSSNKKDNEQNNKVLPQLPLPSPSPLSLPSQSQSPPLPSSSPSMSTLPLSTTTTDTTTTMTKTKRTIAPYVSILTHLKKSRNINPYGILCPYELMGICRDEDCQYIHQSRNQI